MTLSSVKTHEGIAWPDLVAMLHGVSAAQVVKAAQAAAKMAVLCGKRVVEEDHLRHAIRELKPPANEDITVILVLRCRTDTTFSTCL